MKNFTKLLMAVVLLASYSCVQDTTEDLAPVITETITGSGGVKTLQVALPTPTRTELGEKGDDGKYPVYWCAEEGEEDILAVNGEPTTKITLVNPDGENRSSVAIFDMPLNTSIPYNIVYPYTADVEVDGDSGMYPVRFASEQKHTEGSFASGSAPMYAWSDGFSEVQMHHLATALRFTIKADEGKSIDLKYISVSTEDAEPIAGIFDVYCGSNDVNDARTGEIVARDGASSTVFYSFEGDSHTLTSEAQTFYIVVPKGAYARFNVNFVTNDGALCVRTFDAAEGDAVLRGGTVREFPEITFSADSKMLLIGTDVDMKTFADEVKAGTFASKYDGALLIADIDMTGKEWESVEGYASVFEGRNYTIKGLTTPLFGENTVATISNLNVEGNIVETQRGKVGLIARSLSVDGDKVGKIFNCTAKGSLVYDNPNLEISEDLALINIGGVVGGVYGANVSLSKSEVEVEIATVGPANETKAFQPCIGGVVGYSCSMNDVAPVVVENNNLGAVIWNDDSESVDVSPFIGGVAGYVVAGDFVDNVNNAILTIAKPMRDLDWGGVLGASKVSIERCLNKGSLTIDKEITYAHIGGVVGRLIAGESADVKTSIIDCDNYGKMLFDDEFLVAESCNIGGVVSNVEVGTGSVERCDNYGEITYLGSCKWGSRNNTTGVGNASLRLGGVVGLCYSEKLSECNNMQGANINIAGGVAGRDSSTDVSVISSIAGVVATRSGKQSVLGCSSPVITEKCSNAGKISCSYTYLGYPLIATSACIGILDSDRVEDCHNAESGEFEYSTSVATSSAGTETTTRRILYVSCLVSMLFSDCLEIHNCSNSGKLLYDNATGQNLYVAGILGYSKLKNARLYNCNNQGEILVGENIDCSLLVLGGMAGSTTTYESLSYNGCYNTGNIVAKANAVQEVRIGGLFGQSTGSNPENAAESSKGVYNEGRVVFAGYAPEVKLGGYCGRYEEEYHNIEFENRGTVELSFIQGAKQDAVCIGGFAGEANCFREAISAPDVAEFVINNRGNVRVYGNATNIYASGGIGYLSANVAIKGIHNSGEVEVAHHESATTYPENIHIGGVFAYAELEASYSDTSYRKKVTECDNSGRIIYKGIALDGAYVGGVVGLASRTPIVNCENSGSIISSGHAGDWAPRMENASTDRARRYVQFLKHDLAIGGVVGETDSDMSACTNSGAVTHTCLLSPIKADFNGESAPSRFDLGGVAGRAFTTNASQRTINFASLNNTKDGVITIYGSPYATTNTSSVGVTAATQGLESRDIDDTDRTNTMIYYRVNAAGVIGRLLDNTGKDVEYNINSCTNSGNILVPEAGAAKCFNVGGVVGEVLASKTTFTNAKNSGAISLDNVGLGTGQATTARYHSYFIQMGGILGSTFDIRWRYSGTSKEYHHESLIFNQCENSGKIHFGEVAASFFQNAGGILGQALHWIGDMGKDGSSAVYYYSDLDLQFNNCTNSGDIEYVSSAMSLTYNYGYAGGILGNSNVTATNYQQRFGAINCTLSNCKNSGSIQFDRCNGYISTNAAYGYSAVGGMVGFYCGGIGRGDGPAAYEAGLGPKLPDAYNLKIESCQNSGRIWGFTGAVGGIIGIGYWFVKITGTEDNPTINTGDIVVARNAGSVVLRNHYGTKVTYAGGIAGVLWEYHSDNRHLWRNTSTNEGFPPYSLGSQYVRVEHAVNKGAVGGTGAAGGIVGNYQSMKVATAKIAPTVTHKGGIEFCRNEGDIYSLEGATSRVGAIIGMERSFQIPHLSTTSTSYTSTDEAEAVAAEPWQRGVLNCEISGTILRGANRKFVADKDNYQDCIYGESWDEERFVSVVEAKYDGCTFYKPESDVVPDEGEEPETTAVRR